MSLSCLIPNGSIGLNMFNHIHDDLAAWISKLERCPHVNTACTNQKNTVHGSSCSWPCWRYNKPVSRIMGSGNITFFTLLRMSWHVPPPKDCHDCILDGCLSSPSTPTGRDTEEVPLKLCLQLESTIPNKSAKVPRSYVVFLEIY